MRGGVWALGFGFYDASNLLAKRFQFYFLIPQVREIAGKINIRERKKFLKNETYLRLPNQS